MDGGPPWEKVRFRTTVRTDTRQTLEDMISVDGKSDAWLHRSLPERHIPISTTLHYQVEDDDTDVIFRGEGLDLTGDYCRSRNHIYGHYPSDPNCPVCRLARSTRRHARKRDHKSRQDEPECDRFGSRVHCDFLILREANAGHEGERSILVVHDEFTQFTCAYPLHDRSSETVAHCIRDFAAGKADPSMIYSDGGPELEAACRMLAIAHYPGEPGRSTTHARAERKIRTLKDTIRALLLQSGLPVARWTWCVQAAATALNILWEHPDGETSYDKRFKVAPKPHWLAPFGTLVYAMPPKTQMSTVHPLQPRFVPCVSMGPLVLPGGRVGSALRVLPLDIFIRSDGKMPNKLWITRDWKPCMETVFPLRDFKLARHAARNLQEESYETAPLSSMHGFMIPNHEIELATEVIDELDRLLRTLPPAMETEVSGLRGEPMDQRSTLQPSPPLPPPHFPPETGCCCQCGSNFELRPCAGCKWSPQNDASCPNKCQICVECASQSLIVCRCCEVVVRQSDIDEPANNGIVGRDDRPFPSWDDHSIISPPPSELTRRLEQPRIDRLYDGTLMKVKSNSRRPPWYAYPEAWITLPLRDREKEMSKWRDYHSKGMTLAEVRTLEGFPIPCQPKFVVEELKRNPSIDVRDIPTPVLVSDLDSNQLPSEQLLIPSTPCSMYRRVRFSDAPGICFADRARKEEAKRCKQKIFLVEVCCETCSTLGMDALRGDAEVYRITKEMDITSKVTVDRAMDIIAHKISEGYVVHLHASTPCTGGSIIQNVNLAKGMSPSRLEEYAEKAEQMITHFGSLARMAVKKGATISVEWPRHCSYWDRGWYCRLKRQCGLSEVVFDGCMVGCAPGNGRVGERHLRHKKPWRIDTNNPEIIRVFSGLRCDPSCQDHEHTPIEGRHTKRSGEYSPTMCARFHRALRATWHRVKKNCHGLHAPLCTSIGLEGDCLAEQTLENAAVRSCVCQSLDSQRTTWESTAPYWDMTIQEAVDANLVPALALQAAEDIEEPQPDTFPEGHREIGSYPNPLDLVTETLHRNDPRYHCQQAQDAFASERDKLNACSTWDSTPIERVEAKRIHPEATFSRVFTLLGIKGSEGDSDQKYKARSVLQGNNMVDADGDAVFYSDASSAPTTMSAIRSVLSFGVMCGRGATQADGTQAFVQPHLPSHVIIYVHVPPELRTPAQQKAAKDMVSPVFRLLRPLYGWACSGKLWAEHLDGKMKLCGWSPVEGWIQTYVKRVGENTLITTVYVDDFVMAGVGHEQEWDKLREHIVLGEVTPVSKVLGVQHHVTCNSQTTVVEVEMSDFLRSAIDKYNEIAGAPKLKDSAHTPWRQHGPEEPFTMNDKGVLGNKAASLLMKILYAARMCRPDLIWTITTLARFITKWTKFHDLQLAHLYSYIQGTLNVGLSVTLPSFTANLDRAKLILYVDADHAGGLGTTKSMSGGFLVLSTGEHTMPLDWYSKLQSSTACSSTEAELIAFNRGVKQCGLGQKMLWEQILGREIELVVKEDNASAIRDVETGYSSQLRHVLSKVHRVNLGSLNELLTERCFTVEFCPTNEQLADGLTKGLARIKHEQFMRMIGMQAMSALGSKSSALAGQKTSRA
eukprot:2921705-Amphidinium_carterae.1